MIFKCMLLFVQIVFVLGKVKLRIPSIPRTYDVKTGAGVAMKTSLSLSRTVIHDSTERTWSPQFADNKTNGQSITWTNEVNCGTRGMIPRSRMTTGPRIINGSISTVGEWPWQAMLKRYYDSSGKFFLVCGGTLINKQWVVTAAHCFGSEPIWYTRVGLGAYHKDLSDPTVKLCPVSSVKCHGGYVGMINTYQDDICLIKLAGEITYTTHIRPICLPTLAAKQTDQCTITGWGETGGLGNNELLQKAAVDVIPKADCESWYGVDGILLPEKHICAGHELGLVDSCQGDSGGPLVCTKKPSLPYVLQGITSFGLGCAVKQRPGVYTGVINYMDWIAAVVSTSPDTDQCFSPETIHPCNKEINATESLLRSPVKDLQTWIYPENKKCSWNIRAPVGHHIKFEFMCFFHVEINQQNKSECYDYVNITSATADVTNIYCGTRRPAPVTIHSNEAILSFHSDATVQYSGFVVKVTFKENHEEATEYTKKPRCTDFWNSFNAAPRTLRINPLLPLTVFVLLISRDTLLR